MFKFFIQLLDSIVWPLVIITAIWLAFFLNHGYDLDLNYYGMRPHEIRGLLGIFTMPLLHGNFDHLFSNSIPLLVSLAFIFQYFKTTKWKIIVSIYLFSGVLLWFIGKSPSNHIGASGLVYGFIAFLITHAFINKNKQTIAAAFILIFLYGSLIYGIFPDYGRLIGKNISWEGHLAGMLIGIIVGFVFRQYGPQKIVYEDDDDDEHYPWFPDEEIEHDNESINYHYHYKSKDTDADS